MAEDKIIVPLAGYERADIGERFIWVLAAGCLVMLVACALLVLWLYPGASLDRRLERPLPAYPAPQLQSDPAADMIDFRKREMQRLDGVGWSDRERRTVHIPIALAMQKLVEEGIPAWPARQAAALSPAGSAPPPDSAPPPQASIGRPSP